MRIAVLLFVFAVNTTAIVAQKNFLITSKSAAGVRIGMTVSQARKVLSGCRLKRSSDGEGVVLIAADCGRKHVMTFYAGEEDFEARIDERAKIEFIEVWDPRFKTRDGIHPKMLVSQAEKRIGKLKKIILTEIESREFIEFSQERKGIAYRVYGGIYPPGKTTTTRYRLGIRLYSIQVRKHYVWRDHIRIMMRRD